MKMNVITTTNFRKNISKYMQMLNADKSKKFIIGRRNNPEAIIVPYNKNYSFSTNVAFYGGSLDFLKDEPDLYYIEDTLEWKAKHKKSAKKVKSLAKK